MTRTLAGARVAPDQYAGAGRFDGGGADVQPGRPPPRAPVDRGADARHAPEGRPHLGVDERPRPGRPRAERTVGRIPGNDPLSWVGDHDPVFEELLAFLGTEAPASRERGQLATVLFTDIVDSTTKAAAQGDASWRETLQRHHEAVRACLTAHGGTEVDTAGDGFFATLDGPAAAVRCAIGHHRLDQGDRLEVRAGVHTGEVEDRLQGRWDRRGDRSPDRVEGRSFGGVGIEDGSKIPRRTGLTFEDAVRARTEGRARSLAALSGRVLIVARSGGPVGLLRLLGQQVVQRRLALALGLRDRLPEPVRLRRRPPPRASLPATSRRFPSAGCAARRAPPRAARTAPAPP